MPESCLRKRRGRRPRLRTAPVRAARAAGRPASLPAARATYLSDGSEPDSFTFDGLKVQSTELTAPATPTTAVPADSDSIGLDRSAAAGPQQIQIGSGVLGAPVDLWDTDWPGSGYYWTVIPVEAVSPGALKTSTAAAAAIGGTGVTVDQRRRLLERRHRRARQRSEPGNRHGRRGQRQYAHARGDTEVGAWRRRADRPDRRQSPLPGSRAGAGRVRCAVQPRGAIRQEQRAGPHGCRRALRLGPVPEGTPHSGTNSQAFYGSPLVAWTPALGATVYEVQWSKKRYPFKPQPNPQNQNALGTIVLGTSTVLPLKPGTWYYRVRGFNYGIADRCTADVLVGPRQNRRRETQVPRRRSSER